MALANLQIMVERVCMNWRIACVILLVCRGSVAEIQAGFRYADDVTTTGGQFNLSYPPSNLINNGFTSPTNTIDTRVDYLAAGNNYATLTGTTANFDLKFNFSSTVDLTAMHVWNYVFRNGVNGATSTNNGVNAYTLTFYSGTNGTGSVLGSFSGNLIRAAWNALNLAQTVSFGGTNVGVRSVVMHVVSSYGGSSFTGIDELAFETASETEPPVIISFTASTNLVTYGNVATLSWQVGAVTNLVINNGVGNVLLQTTNGVGSIQIAPTNGFATYTLTANNVSTSSVSLIGLPQKEKLHIYLLMGQSNMEGAGTTLDPVLDAPQGRVLQFGSRDGMESQWIQAHHPLTSLTAGGSVIGMGLEFAKTMLASNSDPGVVICLINHAKGTTAIQWWAPGVLDDKQINPANGSNYYLYDEALARAKSATNYGLIKGVLWHQGEYNCNTNNSNPSAEPELYAQRVQALVDNLRRDLALPGLPFICGKFVPPWTNSFGTTFVAGTLHRRDIVEAALDDLPNQRFNTACAANAGLIGREDQTIHFDAGSQRELGRRYAQKLLAISAAASVPPPLGFQFTNSQLVLAWPFNYTGWTLQIQTNALSRGLSTNWVVVSGSTGTNRVEIPINATNGSSFFRLQSP